MRNILLLKSRIHNWFLIDYDADSYDTAVPHQKVTAIVVRCDKMLLISAPWYTSAVRWSVSCRNIVSITSQPAAFCTRWLRASTIGNGRTICDVSLRIQPGSSRCHPLTHDVTHRNIVDTVTPRKESQWPIWPISCRFCCFYIYSAVIPISVLHPRVTGGGHTIVPYMICAMSPKPLNLLLIA